MGAIVWTPNGDDGAMLAHVGTDRFNGIYLGYVSHYDDGKGWRYAFLVARPFGDRECFVSSRAAGMAAVRRKWKRFMERAGLEYAQ